MKRTKQTKKAEAVKADAILTADWHLREPEKNPICRTDNFWETQWKKVKFISNLQEQHDCPVFHAGDLFDHWKPSPYLLSMAITHLPKDFRTVYGNHDLPQHNLDLIHKTGIYTLQHAKALSVLDVYHWGQDPKTHAAKELETVVKGNFVLVWHIYTYQTKTWPGNTAPKAAKLLRQYPKYDLILTGDNHQAFVEEYEGKLLVNPGSIFRMDADQIDFKPRVYLYYADTNSVEPVFLPIEPVITREHIEGKEERDNRIQAFVERLNTDYEGGVSFEDNLEKFFSNNRVHTSIKDIIYKSLEP
jgi:DNA repair exonuclease SbcCD nuclease subunit